MTMALVPVEGDMLKGFSFIFGEKLQLPNGRYQQTNPKREMPGH